MKIKMICTPANVHVLYKTRELRLSRPVSKDDGGKVAFPRAVIVFCNLTVAPLSVYIADTLMLLPLLSQCYPGHCCHSLVRYTAVTILSLRPISQ